MNNKELLKKLINVEHDADPEEAHIKADRLLLEFIDDPVITQAFNDIEKWYA